MWQQTDPFVSPLEVQAPGSGLQRSNGRVREETDSEAEPDWVKGSCAVSAARLKDGSKTSPAILVLSNDPQVVSPGNLLPTSAYHQGRGTLCPQNLPPALQTSPPDPPKASILKLAPQLDPVRVSIQSSPSVDFAQMPSEVQNLVSGWKAEAAARGEVR